jgi:hypothetical protein
MKKILVASLLITICFSAIAGNIKLEVTKTNCLKVNNFAADDPMAIATKYQVPLSSVNFLGAKWGRDEYALDTCILTFDTAKGPKQCKAFQLWSDNNGKTAFAETYCFSK